MDEENVSDDENMEESPKTPENSAGDGTNKRLKTDISEKSSETNVTETASSEAASTSTNDVTIHKRNNVKSRNYRRRRDDASSPSDGETAGDSERRSSSSRLTDSENSQDGYVSRFLSSTITHLLDEMKDEKAEEPEELPVLKKPKPKHNWFVVPEILNRQLGNRGNRQNNILFQKRCYGSLHCVERLELMYKLEQHEGCVNSLNFHPNGTLLASGSDDLKVVVWDWKHGKSLLSFETKHRGNVFQSKFLPLSGDLHIATSARDGQVRLAQVSRQEGLRSIRKLGSHYGPAHKLAILCDQPHVIISVGEDGLVLSHDVRNNRPNKILNVKNDDYTVALYSVSAHPLNTHEFCVSGRDHIVRVYDQRKCSKSSTPLHSYHPDTKDLTALHVTCAVYNYNGSEVLASYNNDNIYTFETDTPAGKWTHKYEGHRNGATIKGVNYFGPRSEYVVSGSDCGHVYFWDKETETIVQWMLADDARVVNCLEPHPQLPFICTSGLDWDVKVWVPSCEHKPTMEGLEDVIRENNDSRDSILSAASGDINDNRMLWRLWRHFNRPIRLRDGDAINLLDELLSSSSSSSFNSDSDDADDDDDVERAGCVAS